MTGSPNPYQVRETFEDQTVWLAEPGHWDADFNDAQTACYNGSMGACDSIWLRQPMVLKKRRLELRYVLHECNGRTGYTSINRSVVPLGLDNHNWLWRPVGPKKFQNGFFIFGRQSVACIISSMLAPSA